MKATILGAGRMCGPAAQYLIQHPEVEKVQILDKNMDAVLGAVHKLDSSKVSFGSIDVSDSSTVVRAIRGSDAVLSLVPYRFNYRLAQAALKAGCHFLDLGGNNDIVDQQLSLHKEAQKRDLLIVNNCGLAPGLAPMLATKLVKEFDTVDSLQLRVGGLDQHPSGRLNYALMFSVEGLINEYSEPCTVLRNGKLLLTNPMEDLETITFPYIGKLEAFNTSGGASRLPEMLQGKVRNLDYKTIRCPGHAEEYKKLVAEAGSRQRLEGMLLEMLPEIKEDVVLMQVTGIGRKGADELQISYVLIDHYDPATGFTAMMKTTAYPAAILTHLIGTGRVEQRGAYCMEEVAPADLVLDGLLAQLKDYRFEKSIKTLFEVNI
jgi:lysine 6-dehydrogenase